MRNKIFIPLSFIAVCSNISAAQISFTAGNAAVAADVNANFTELYNAKWTLTATDLSYSAGNVGIGVANPGVKFGIMGGTAVTLAGATGFGVFGSATGNHIAVDTNQIQAKSNGTTANGLRLNPLGGNVGIGVATPNAKLHVDGGSAVTLAGATGFEIIGDSAGAHTAISTTQIQAKGSATTSADLLINPLGGNVGIGTVSPAAKLYVVTANNTSAIEIGTSATPLVGESTYYTAQGRASFGYDGVKQAVSISDRNAAGATSTKHIVFETGGAERMRLESGGNVGINSTNPGAKLEVFDSVSGAGTVVASNVAVLKNSSNAGGADGMMIWLSGEGGNTALDGANNFLTFTVASSPSAVGSIQGSGVAGGGVTLNTTSGDYAEMLPKANPDESFKIGDIIAVDNGRASASANGTIFMPYSSGPAVLGNSPQDPEVSKRYAPLGFVGQVKIKVRGLVQNGDFVLASRTESGVGYALNGKKIKPEDFHRVVGRAWESSSDQRVKLINCLVGVPQAYPYQEVATQMQMMSRQKEAEMYQQISQLSREVAKAHAQKQSDLTLLKNENVQLRSALKEQDLRLTQLEQNLARVAQRLDNSRQAVARR